MKNLTKVTETVKTNPVIVVSPASTFPVKKETPKPVVKPAPKKEEKKAETPKPVEKKKEEKKAETPKPVEKKKEEKAVKIPYTRLESVIEAVSILGLSAKEEDLTIKADSFYTAKANKAPNLKESKDDVRRALKVLRALKNYPVIGINKKA